MATGVPPEGVSPRRPVPGGTRRAGRAPHASGFVRWVRDGRVLSVVILLAVWQVAGTVGRVNPIVLPTPSRIGSAAVDMLASGQLEGAFLFSLQTLIPGFLLAAAVGVPLGLFMGASRVADRVFDPYVAILLGTPLIAFIPLLIVWFGLGTVARVAAGFIFALPLIVMNTQAGVRQVPASVIEMARSFEVPESQLFRKILLPGALPPTVVGLRLGIAHAVKGVIIAEMLMTLSGLGGLIIAFSGAFRTAHLLMVVIVALLIVLAVTQLFTWLHRRLAPWDVAARRRSTPR